jgi:hypothetical protein
MKKTIIGIALIAAITFALALAGCDNGGGGEKDTLGIVWKPVKDSTLSNVSQIVYGGGKFVARGLVLHDDGNLSGCKMAHSSDGVKWTAVADSTFDSDDSIFAIAYGNNTFVAVGNNSYTDSFSIKMAYSIDGGVIWTAVPGNPFGSDDIFKTITYGGDKFFAIGGGTNYNSSGGFYIRLASSIDGIDWTSSIVFSSDDETRTNTLGSIREIVYDNGKFVARGSNGKIMYSSDGTTWTTATDSTFDSNDEINAIAYGNGKFVVVGADTDINNTSFRQDCKIAYSTDDGVTWTAVKNPFISDDMYRNAVTIAYGNGKFVAFSDCAVEMATSSDGIKWKAIVNNYGISPLVEILSDSYDGSIYSVSAIAYGNGKFVVGCREGKMAYSE